MNPGVFIDIDGVLLSGGKPFEWTKESIHVKNINIALTYLKAFFSEKFQHFEEV
jgi:hypothetical protein